MPAKTDAVFRRFRWEIYATLFWLLLLAIQLFVWKPYILGQFFEHGKSIESRRLDMVLRHAQLSHENNFLKQKLDRTVALNVGWDSWKQVLVSDETRARLPDNIISGLYVKDGKNYLVTVELDKAFFINDIRHHIRQQIILQSTIIFLILLFLAIYVRKRLEQPMLRLIETAEKVACGNLDEDLKVNDTNGFVRRLAFSLGTMRDNLRHALALMEEEVNATKESRERLSASEERFRKVFEHIADIIIIVDEEGIVRRVNPAIRKILGYEPEEITGKNINILLPPYLRPDHDGYVDGYLRTAVKKIIDKGIFEVPVCNKQGEEVVCGLSISEMTLADGRFFVGVMRDIRERLAMEQTMRYERDRAQKYLDTVEVMILAYDLDGKITLVNRKAREVLKLEDGKYLGKDWYECCVDASVSEGLRELMNDVVAGKSKLLEYMEYPICTGVGEQRHIAWHLSRILDDQGGCKGFLCSGEDITEQRKNDEERYRLKSQLLQAQKMESVGQLTGGIAHDFNNILASVLGYNELAQDWVAKYKDEKLDGYLASIHNAGIRARDLVEKMLAYSRGKGKIGKAELSLVPVIQDALKMLRSVLPSSVMIRSELDEMVPNINMDTIELQQIIMNLCINARDAMEGQGQITISVRRHHDLKQHCSSCFETFSGEYIELAIADNGPGIPLEEQKKIFEPFFSTKAMGKGSGMGLSVVHGIVHGRGGHLRLESYPGKGSTFHLYFRPAGNEIKTANQVNTFSRHAIKSVSKLMVVEHEQVIAQHMRELLEKDGYRVILVNDPVEALRRYRQDPSAYDLVITDLSLPGMTGLELAAMMLMEQPGLPIVICNDGEEADREEILAAGIRGVIDKPSMDADLVSSVREALAA